ncbi:hypothetical protein [Endozoicomonas sp. ALC020]|uniref:hypothetical protein n=1 Tax=unclassified Endozoicomonas TaxID=2644528 RepID=UPI003BAE4368
MKFLIILLTSFLLSACSNLQIKGKKEGDYFFPAPQAWKVIEAEPLGKLSKDQKGIQYIYKRSVMYFSEDYFTTVNFNNGLYYVIGSCFKISKNRLTAIPMIPFKKYFDKSLEFKVNGEIMTVTLPNKMKLTLKKLPAESFSEVRHHNYQQALAYMLKRSTLFECTSDIDKAIHQSS